MQAGENVDLIEATARESFHVMRHAWTVGLSTQKRAISITHEIFAMKSQQVVHVIMVAGLEMTVGWTRGLRIRHFSRTLLIGDVCANLVHQALHVQVGSEVVRHGLRNSNLRGTCKHKAKSI